MKLKSSKQIELLADRYLGIKRKTKVNYKKYIKSSRWKKLKETFYTVNKRECVICKSTKQCDIHHLSYKNLGSESLKDIVCLCKDCHDEFHSEYGVQTDSLKSFTEFCCNKVNNPVIPNSPSDCS